MQDPGTRGHPLGRAVGDQAAATGGVLVLERPVDHVRHGLEAPVRVPGGALGLAGGVLDGTHVVEQQERVGERQVHAGERPAYDEALALDLAARGDDLADRAPRAGGLGGCGEAGQGQGIGGDSWHGALPDANYLRRQQHVEVSPDSRRVTKTGDEADTRPTLVSLALASYRGRSV